MSTAPGEDRRRAILARAREIGHVDVGEISQLLAVAAETVRRDLRQLEAQGLVRRTHGGAYPVESGGFESTMRIRSESRVAEKRRIAAATVQLLDNAESIYLDEGYTPQLIAEDLVRLDRTLTVVTSSVGSAGLLARGSQHRVILLGGRVRSNTVATVDHWAVNMLGGLHVDVAILGANGISCENGLTTPDPAVAAVKETAVRVSRRRIFVGVHTKFGVTSFCRFAEVGDFEVIVTETALPAREGHRYQALGPHVLRV
jgi:DeoR/GlpR family transcriptional regulator of sugar metabolism